MWEYIDIISDFTASAYAFELICLIFYTTDSTNCEIFKFCIIQSTSPLMLPSPNSGSIRDRTCFRD